MDIPLSGDECSRLARGQLSIPEFLLLIFCAIFDMGRFFLILEGGGERIILLRVEVQRKEKAVRSVCAVTSRYGAS